MTETELVAAERISTATTLAYWTMYKKPKHQQATHSGVKWRLGARGRCSVVRACEVRVCVNRSFDPFTGCILVRACEGESHQLNGLYYQPF